MYGSFSGRREQNKSSIVFPVCYVGKEAIMGCLSSTWLALGCFGKFLLSEEKHRFVSNWKVYCMIVLTTFVFIIDQMEFRLVHNRTELINLLTLNGAVLSGFPMTKVPGWLLAMAGVLTRKLFLVSWQKKYRPKSFIYN